MSHVVIGTVEVKDLRAVKAACKRLGIEFREGQKTHVYYGGNGQCDHALHVPGVNYEIGLVKTKTTAGGRQSNEFVRTKLDVAALHSSKGAGYRLAHDFYGDGAFGRHDGKKLEAVVGKDCGKFLQAYGTEFTKMQLKSKGLIVSERKVGTDIKLSISGF